MKTERSSSELQQLLYTRAQAARLLGCSVWTVIRLQRAGKLKPRRLTGKDTGQVYFRYQDLVALAGGED